MKKSIVLVMVISLSLVAAIYAATTLRLTFNRYALIKSRIDFIDSKNAAHQMLAFVRASIKDLRTNLVLDQKYRLEENITLMNGENVTASADVIRTSAEPGILKFVITVNDVCLKVKFRGKNMVSYEIGRV